MGKKYHETNARADKKGEKERKDKGNEKKSDKKTEQEQCFKNYGKLGKKMQAIGDIISYFAPIILIVTLKAGFRIRIRIRSRIGYVFNRTIGSGSVI
jgi:hypothetical protein